MTDSRRDKLSHTGKEMAPFSAADLPMSKDGTVYHLSLSRQQLSNDIVLVGDPGRVTKIASEFFKSRECEVTHRGLTSITGTVKESGRRVSVITHGMGTPSLEIVLTELMAINEIDPRTRTRRENFEPLNIVRVGTSGLLQADAPLGTSIISSCAVGLDNTGLFYDLPAHDSRSTLVEQQVDQMLGSVMTAKQRFYKKIHSYAAFPHADLLEALIQSAEELGYPYDVGVTVSSSGFSANQGRAIGRISPSVPDIDRHLSELPPPFPLGRYLNMEMEASFLLHFAAGHGYRAGVVCAGIANRRLDSFANDTNKAVSNATAIALKALDSMRVSSVAR